MYITINGMKPKRARVTMIFYCFLKISRKDVLYHMHLSAWFGPFRLIRYSTIGGGVKYYLVNFGLAASPSQLWFIVMLFGVFIMAWPLSDLFRRNTVKSIVICIGLYMFGYGMGRIFLNIFNIFSACQYLLFFLIGFKIRQYKEKWKVSPANLAIAAGSSFILFFYQLFLASSQGIYFKLLRVLVLFLLHCIGAVMAFEIMQLFADRFKMGKVFQSLNRNSMAIYLLHQQIIWFMIEATNGKLHPYLNAFIIAAAALLIAWLFSLLIGRFRLGRIALGIIQK